MKTNLITAYVVLLALIVLPLTAASIPTAKPEEVGLSSERLQRVHQMIQRHIDAGDISGAVTLVARKGRIAHLEAHGLMDIESKKPMPKDAIFRIASMSKVVTGTAIMMLVEEGKIRLTDPVSKFIPEFRGQKVAVALPAGRGGAGAGGGGRRAGRRSRGTAVLYRSGRERDYHPRPFEPRFGSGQRDD
ncbi:MAG: estB 3 [Bryobacterales bacterium]|nr:estB 3 [Bryobacterales bacterium]